MKAGARNRSLFLRIISAPVRVLIKARDVYVRKMSDYADRVGYGSMGCQGGSYPPLPRSFSATAASSRSSTNDDLRELIRAASARSYGDRIDVETILGRQNSGAVLRRPNLGSRVLPKSSSVRMGRIDEDTTYEFGAATMKRERPYSRSRSCASAGGRPWCAVEAY